MNSTQLIRTLNILIKPMVFNQVSIYFTYISNFAPTKFKANYEVRGTCTELLIAEVFLNGYVIIFSYQIILFKQENLFNLLLLYNTIISCYYKKSVFVIT